MWWSRHRVPISRDRVPFTRGILQSADPQDWRSHRFGLSGRRWDSLAGRSFWITGAGTGFGRCIALALAAAGARTFITGRRRAKLKETLAEGLALGVNVEHCLPVPCDIRSQAELANAIRVIAEHAGALSGLVNGAALAQPDAGPRPLADLDAGQWSELIQTNVTAQWLVTRAALPLLTSKQGARVVFVSSDAGWADTPGFGPYNVSKSALNTLGISFAAECKTSFPEHDMQVNVLVPGEARTEMNQESVISPYAVVSMALALLSHPPHGPNGHCFHRDGRHLAFANSHSYIGDLLNP